MPVVELGTEIEREGKLMRCVRITHQTSLFQTEGGQSEVLEEDLIEWKAANGELDFEVLTSTRNTYAGPSGTIKAPEPISWRKE